MFQLRRILLSGLVALLMVGMVSAGELKAVDTGGNAETERSYIGSSGTWGGCQNTDAWRCIRLEFYIDINIPW